MTGGMFEKIIAKLIGGIAETVFDLTTSETFGVGFKQYDELIFGNTDLEIAPFTKDMWNLMIEWYWRIARNNRRTYFNFNSNIIMENDNCRYKSR